MTEFPAKGTWRRRAGKTGHTNSRDGGDDLTKLELVKDGGLAGGIETDHQNAHLLFAP